MFQLRSFVLIYAVFFLTLAIGTQPLACYAATNPSSGGSRPVTPAPRPTAKPTPKPPPLAAPTGVRPVQSKHDCASALSLLAAVCDSAVKAGVLQLIWHDSATKLTGYKVYRVDGGRHTLVLTLTNGPSPKYGAISKPNGGYGHACYAVTANLGQRESARSASYCVRQGATATTATFTPAHVRSYVTISNPGLYDPNNNNGQLPLSTLLSWLQKSGFDKLVPSQVSNSQRAASINGTGYVGYQSAYVSEPNPTNGEFYTGTNHGYVTIKSRAGYDFNLGKLANRSIYSAILTLDVSQTSRDTSSHNGFVTSDYSCADRYLLGKDFWWSQSGPLNNAASGAEFSQGAGPVVTIDVTKTVADWAAGAPSYGFILSNALADVSGAKPAYPDLACFTKYYTAQLKVIYF